VGVCHVRLGDLPAARAAFEQALLRVPHHPLALAGLAIVARREGRVTLAPGRACCA
jgi:hypothetical protein